MIDWTERFPLVMRFVAARSKRFIPKESVCMIVLSVMVTACRPAFALAVVIFACNQFVMRAISARMQRSGSGGSGWSVVVRAV